MSKSAPDILLREKRKVAIVKQFNKLYNVKRFRYDYVLYLLRWEHFFLYEKQIHKILKSAGANIPSGYFKIKTTHYKDGLTALEVRNNKLRERFKQLAEDQKIRLDDTVEILRSEFFISSTTITHVIQEYSIYKQTNPQSTLNLE